MRKWNKLLATLLAMVMVFGLTATAFAAEGDAKTEDEKTEATTPADTDKKDDETAAPAEGEDKADDAAPAEGEDKTDDATPAEGEDKTDDATPAEGEDKTDDTTPADEDKKDEPSTDTAPVTFSDVKDGQWFYEHVQKMVAAGIVSGYADGSFKPNEAVTWGAAAKMVVVFVTGEEKAPVEGGNWASGYVAYLKEQGIWTEEINHNANITRLEMCQLLAKALKVAASEEESSFSDTKDGYVVALAKLEVIGGNPDGTFDPNGELSRAALCRILASVPDSVKNPQPAAPAEGEDKTDDATPAEGEEKKDDAAPAEGEDKTDDATPDDADKKDDAPAADDSADKKDDAKAE